MLKGSMKMKSKRANLISAVWLRLGGFGALTIFSLLGCMHQRFEQPPQKTFDQPRRKVIAPVLVTEPVQRGSLRLPPLPGDGSGLWRPRWERGDGGVRASRRIREILRVVPVLPVLTIERLERAVPLARALAAGGLRVMEVTLRTDAAVDAVRRIAEDVPEVVIGAGTVTRPAECAAVLHAGAQFAVTPGLTPALARAANEAELPLVPGVMTPSEALAARDLGFDVLKLFPARVAGGIELLKAFRGPLPDLLFCPTGGIDAASFRDYLALPNVLCVGGSWVAPKAAIEAGDWARITELAREATA